MINFEINIGDIINTIISLVLGAMITLWIVEARKTSQKRKILLEVLKKNIEAYSDLDNETDFQKSVIGSPQRSQIFINILSSDILNVKKDKELIILLHEMVGWVENYNAMNNLANLGILLQSPVGVFNEGRNILNHKSRADVNKLKELLKNYK
ncbi:hypothetical protein [Paenibacillus sp. GXUN7292]|uniref:hypothetical protein n=1 Tax=Paenibacillus sp. GXUN7292 TaxID=3422499 RepID=UPI003D7EEBEB